MSQTAKMVINDPESFHVLTTDAKKSIIKAATNTVNIQAALGRKNTVRAIKDKFITRNTFTTRQVQYDKMPNGLYSLKAIKSTVGITQKADYMERQDKGGTHRPKTGSKLAIPTDTARGGKSKALPRMYRINNVGRKKVKGNFKKNLQSKRARQVARVFEAFKTGKLVSFGNNLHKVTSFTKSGNSIHFKLKQIYNFSKTKTQTPPEPFFEKATEKPARDGQRIFNSQMDKIAKI